MTLTEFLDHCCMPGVEVENRGEDGWCVTLILDGGYTDPDDARESAEEMRRLLGITR